MARTHNPTNHDLLQRTRMVLIWGADALDEYLSPALKGEMATLIGDIERTLNGTGTQQTTTTKN